MIPHFRPHATPLATLNGTNEMTLIQNAHLARPLRFTGELMFDASHKPCTNGTASSDAPARSSSWEVHPVYRVDVCQNTTLTACAATDSSVWTPLDQWLVPSTRE
ncbi:MAG TPA: hypothetical protein VFA43_24790 [Gemmatimonadaceae bacterium]|nr:hypothetical protein [Gemmatimonadaceae bacterium]